MSIVGHVYWVNYGRKQYVMYFMRAGKRYEYQFNGEPGTMVQWAYGQVVAYQASSVALSGSEMRKLNVRAAMDMIFYI